MKMVAYFSQIHIWIIHFMDWCVKEIIHMDYMYFVQCKNQNLFHTD